MTDHRDEARLSVDAPSPPEGAKKVLDYLTGKVCKPTSNVFVLSILAGVYIAFGSIGYLVVGAGGPEGFSGPQNFAAGLAFTLGLVLVIVAGAELFTGDTMMVIGRVRGSLDRASMWSFWALVYGGNLVGSLLISLLFVMAGGHMLGDGTVGLHAIEVAEGKVAGGAIALTAAGILANMLVCLAVWMAQIARTVAGQVLAIIPPIAIFVTAGFEHSVANMSLLPIGLLAYWLADASFWVGLGAAPESYEALGLGGALFNLVFVTIGNIIGGGLVGLSYWYAYLRKS